VKYLTSKTKKLMRAERMSEVEKKFKEKYLAGEIEFEAIDDYSQDWGFSDETVTLREYLGLNAEEEDAWISVGDEALKELLDQQKNV
jgi:hypothetical protein